MWLLMDLGQVVPLMLVPLDVSGGSFVEMLEKRRTATKLAVEDTRLWWLSFLCGWYEQNGRV